MVSRVADTIDPVGFVIGHLREPCRVGAGAYRSIAGNQNSLSQLNLNPTIVTVTFVLSDGIVGTLFLLAEQFDNILWSPKLSESVESLGLDETVRNQRE